jgi:metal-responsive CopG/Arc/MetJ family transcriptional regulator
VSETARCPSAGRAPGSVHTEWYHDVMERTSISLPAEVLQRLRVIAAECRTSMAEIVREAVEEKLAADRPKPRSIAMKRTTLRAGS